MKILNYKAFEGKNIYSHKKCIRLDLDLEGYCEIPSNKIEGFTENLIKLLPELKKHRCGIDEDGGFVKRLYEGTYLAHISEHIVIALQNMMGIDISYGKAREISGDLYYIVYQYEYKNTAIECGRIAVDLINCLINKKQINIKSRINDLKKILRGEQLGPSTLAICNEAKKRGIPVTRIGENSMFQIGYGKYGKRIEATIAENTSAVAVDISCDKLLTKEVLDNQCIPVARGGKVQNSLDLLIKAESLGYPVVLKPRYGNQGKGVVVNIKDEKELLEEYNILSKSCKDIMIEKHITGRDYRVCVVNYEVVAVAERIPPYVIGDGASTIEKLIKKINSDVKRGEGHEKELTKIKIDVTLKSYIAKKGYTINSILPKGEKLLLRENANLSTGGMALDCTDLICEKNKEICRRSAKAVGLNVCGIDICCKDISVPLGDEGVVIEVNAAPGIRMHHYPSSGEKREVASAIINEVFKDLKEDFPIVSVTGTNGKTTTTRLISYVLSLCGKKVGMTSTGGIYIDNICIDKGDTTGPDSALTVLLNKDIDAAVLETARGGIVRRGLAYDSSDIAVITNITGDHLGIDGINTLEELAFVKALVAEAVKPDGYSVINADDEMSRNIVNRIKSNIIFFSRDKNNALLRKNIEDGGYGIYTDNGFINIEHNKEVFNLVKVEDIGITLRGKLQYNVENAMAACAALVGLKIDYNIIKKGMQDFLCDETKNPGRFNMYDVNGVTVVLDYGHNACGYKAVLEGARAISHNRLIGIIGVPGDRLNCNVLEAGKIAGSFFDYVYIKEDSDKRGRKNGEIAELLYKGVLSGGLNENSIEVILSEQEAFNTALSNAVEGDIIIVFFEKHEPLLDIIKNKLSHREENIETEIMA